MEQKKCPQCGKEVLEDWRICAACGAELSGEDEEKRDLQEEKEQVTDVGEEATQSETQALIEDDGAPLNFFDKFKLFIIIGSILVAAAVVAVIVVSCNSGKSKETTGEPTTQSESSSDVEESSDYYDDEYYDEDDYAEGGNDVIEYISDRTVHYDEAKDQYVVNFGLQDAENTYTWGSGTAHIKITDVTENILYEEDLYFSEEDFTDWTNSYWDGERYMCGLYIDKSDVEGGTSPQGALELTVELDNGVSFDPENINIFGLPSKGLDLKIPKLPKIVYEYDYDDQVETAVKVKEITYDASANSDGKTTITLHFTVEMTENHTREASTYAHIGYKLKNSKGVVVDSGSAMTSPISLGEVTVADEIIFDVDANDSYTLTLENSR